MICDQAGVPLEVGHSVAFLCGNDILLGKVADIKEVVSGPSQMRMVVIATKISVPIPNEAGAKPHIPGVFVTMAQEKKSPLVEK